MADAELQLVCPVQPYLICPAIDVDWFAASPAESPTAKPEPNSPPASTTCFAPVPVTRMPDGSD